MAYNYPASSEIDPPSDFSRDKFLSDALLQLSLNDRNKIEEEIHGVYCGAVPETPELLKKSLDAFDAKLNHWKEEDGIHVLRNVVRVSNHGLGGHNRNTRFRGCYLNDPSVRLRFLRCECFNVNKAIERFISFLEIMSEVFGDYVAERPVRRSDFTPEETKALRKSRVQFLPFRDRSGRRVFVTLGTINYHLDFALLLKILLYLHWLASRDVETQRKGIVIHTYSFDEEHSWKDLYPRVTQKFRDDNVRAMGSLPVRVVANNMYWKDTPFSRFLSVAYIYNLAPERRAHTKLHFGEQTEHLYKMASFGLPVDMVPITASGKLKFANHCAWLDAMEMMEDTPPDQPPFGGREIVDCPLVHDVVFRTGATSRYNPGNAYYREVLQNYCQEHSLGNNTKRYEITKHVYNTIVHGRNGRFLEWWKEGSTWIVLQDPEVIRKKIAKAFKDFKYKKAKRQSIDRTVDVAETIVEREHDRKPVSALQEYYSMAHPSKRRKSDCFTSSSSSSDSEDSDVCFGKDFFSVVN